MLALAGADAHTPPMSRSYSDSLSKTVERRRPGGAAAAERGCDHPGCLETGGYRAPRSRINLQEYYWFCLDHVRAYNASWNYYEGMSEAEIEAEIRNDTIWQRPSWPFSNGGKAASRGEEPIRDPFGFFRQGDEAKPDEKKRKRPVSAEEQALLVFQIEPPFTVVALKARYKELVKMHHPDAHGGDKAAEERLKTINQAYATLKASYFS